VKSASTSGKTSRIYVEKIPDETMFVGRVMTTPARGDTTISQSSLCFSLLSARVFNFLRREA